MSLSVKGWSLWVLLALLLCPESLLLSWEEVELCRAFCPAWGPSAMISSGVLTDPGGWAEGTADGCPGLSGGWHAASVATPGPPCRSALLGWAEWPVPEPGWQMGRQLGFGRGRDCGGRAVWEKVGPAEAPVPPRSSYCSIEQRSWIPRFSSVILSGSVCPSASQVPRT